jgi:hypothetical protein
VKGPGVRRPTPTLGRLHLMRSTPGYLRLGALALALGIGCSSARRTPAPPAVPPRGAGMAAATASDDEEPEAAAPAPGSAGQVTIKLLADPRRQAHVFWGRRDLGIAPLELQRPRSSGPLDLLVMADGALPLHTRVYTDRDNTLSLRLYGPGNLSGLLGFPKSFSLPTSGRFTHNAGTFPRLGR